MRALSSARIHVTALAPAPAAPRLLADATRAAAADGVLEIQLLKRNRRGFYGNGCSNADTFWFSLLAGRAGRERLPLQAPPAEYYKTEWERAGAADAHKLRGRRGSSARAAPQAIAAA